MKYEEFEKHTDDVLTALIASRHSGMVVGVLIAGLIVLVVWLTA